MTKPDWRIVAIALSCLIATPAKAQQAASPPSATQPAPALPDTPVGRMAKLYFEANASGEPEKMRAFLAQHFPSARNPDEFVSVREQTQGIDIIAITSATDTRLDLDVRTRRSGRQLRMIMIVDPAPPHHFRTIGLML